MTRPLAVLALAVGVLAIHVAVLRGWVRLAEDMRVSA